ncbi:MAG: hypothetical protein JSS22_12150 [Proteobacteria bacterium]|nr:hypothetical protein [Pseudomonadota bacterium]
MAAMRLAKPARKPAKAKGVSRAKRKTAVPSKPATGSSRVKKKPLSLAEPDLAAKPVGRALKTKSRPKAQNAEATPCTAAATPSLAGMPQSGKAAAAVAARKATMAASLLRVGKDDPVIADDNDEAAKAGLAKQRARRTSARRKDEPSPRIKRTAVERIDDPPPATGALLIERVTRAIERELSLIEVIVGGVRLKGHQRTEAERRARTLASLARTLGEVTRLRAGQQKATAANDDTVPRDLDEFRRALSRRLEQLVAAPAPAPAREHE